MDGLFNFMNGKKMYGTAIFFIIAGIGKYFYPELPIELGEFDSGAELGALGWVVYIVKSALKKAGNG